MDSKLIVMKCDFPSLKSSRDWVMCDTQCFLYTTHSPVALRGFCNRSARSIISAHWHGGDQSSWQRWVQGSPGFWRLQRNEERNMAMIFSVSFYPSVLHKTPFHINHLHCEHGGSSQILAFFILEHLLHAEKYRT